MGPHRPILVTNAADITSRRRFQPTVFATASRQRGSRIADGRIWAESVVASTSWLDGERVIAIVAKRSSGAEAD
jgi:hypothetical protein